MADPSPEDVGGAMEGLLRAANAALLISAVQEHERAEEARRAESKLRASEAELIRFNRVAVGREMRIVELKQRLNELASQLGRAPPFASDTRPVAPSEEVEREARLRMQAPQLEDIAPLEDILCTEELALREARPPDLQCEIDALTHLVETLACDPGAILTELAQTILDAVGADSAGLSLLDGDGTSFYWPAVAGAWSPHIGGGTRRDFGPCGDVLDCDAPLLFRQVERRYGYFRSVTPNVEEALLVPFHVDGRPIGTLWAISHGQTRFDAESLRLLLSLGRFASAGFQGWEFRRSEESRRTAALNLMEDAVLSRDASEAANLELQSLEARTQQMATALAELNRRKDEFLAMLSHELRNPLASIRSATHLMRLERNRSPIQVEAQAIIERQVGQLVRLIDDLLEVSRISTGRMHLRLERCDLRAVVNRAVETVRPQADKRLQSLLEPPFGESVWVCGDSARLEQVVVNLVSNASKYTQSGGRIELTLQQDASEALLCVRDTGVGIAADVLPRVFDLFVQVDASLGDAQGGLGIGLALVKSLVELHQGRVEASSTVGAGSEFRVRLPLQSGSANASSIRSEPASIAPPLKILVVDDNLDAAQSMAQVLRRCGHFVTLAHDGPAALEAVRIAVPEVVLLDIGLPGLGGYQVARIMRADPSLERTTLIALTGFGTEVDKKLSRDAGFDHHFLKPVDFDQLERALESSARRAPV